MFNAFRIHRRRRGLSQRHRDPWPLDDLAPGEVCQARRVLLGQLQGRARRHRQGQILRRSRSWAASMSPATSSRPPIRVQGRRRGACHRQRPERNRATVAIPNTCACPRMDHRPAQRTDAAREHDPRHRGLHRGARLAAHGRQPARRRTSARSRSPARPVASARSRSTSSRAPASRCTRSAASPNTPTTCARSAPARSPRPRRAGDAAADGHGALRRRPGQRGGADAGRPARADRGLRQRRQRGPGRSAALPTTVMPFIIRGVSLLGIASAGTARDIREEVWQHLASDWKPRTWIASARAKWPGNSCPTSSRRCSPAARFGRTLVMLLTQRVDRRLRCASSGRPLQSIRPREGELHMARILIVDDSPSQLMGIRRIVEKLGHEALTAEDGAAGVEVGQARAARPDPDGRGDAQPQRLPGDAHDQQASRTPRTSRSCW